MFLVNYQYLQLINFTQDKKLSESKINNTEV